MKNFLFVIILSAILYGLTIDSTEIAQWRGINRDGIYKETRLLRNWPLEGPKLIWNTDTLGNGYSTPAVTTDKLFVNGETDSMSYVFAFGLNGKLLWKAPNGPEYMGNETGGSFPGARSTPTVYNNLVYASSGNGRIACLNQQTGTELWSVDMIKDFGGIRSKWGYSESLLVDNANVYFLTGGLQKNVVALNRFTGKEKWASKAMADTGSYCSPIIIDLPARKILVTFSAYYLLGLDAQTGQLLWWQKQEDVKYKQQCNTPIYANGSLFYVAGDGNGAVRLELSANGAEIREVWRVKNIKNNYNGFVKLNNLLYTTERSQKLKSIDIATGTITDSLKITKGGLIAADNLLFCYSENGEVNLIDLSKNKMEITGKLKIDKGTKEHFAHPVIANGVLYIRHGKALMAYAVK